MPLQHSHSRRHKPVILLCCSLLCNVPHATLYAVIVLHNSYFTLRVAAVVSVFCSVNWRCSAVRLRNSAANTSGKRAVDVARQRSADCSGLSIMGRQHTSQDASSVCPPYIPELGEWLFNAAHFICMNQIRMTNELS